MKGKTRKKRDRKNLKKLKKGPENANKNSVYAWISLTLVFFFWVPILNVIFILPASMFFGAKAIRNAMREPEQYGGKWVAIIAVIIAAISFVFSLIVLIMDVRGSLR